MNCKTYCFLKPSFHKCFHADFHHTYCVFNVSSEKAFLAKALSWHLPSIAILIATLNHGIILISSDFAFQVASAESFTILLNLTRNCAAAHRSWHSVLHTLYNVHDAICTTRCISLYNVQLYIVG